MAKLRHHLHGAAIRRTGQGAVPRAHDGDPQRGEGARRRRAQGAHDPPEPAGLREASRPDAAVVAGPRSSGPLSQHLGEGAVIGTRLSAPKYEPPRTSRPSRSTMTGGSIAHQDRELRELLRRRLLVSAAVIIGFF